MNDRLAIMQQIQTAARAILRPGRIIHMADSGIATPLCSIGPGGIGSYTQIETHPCLQQPSPPSNPRPSQTTSSATR